MRLQAQSTCAILVDIQERLVSSIFENERLQTNSIKLISGLQALQTPILITQQYSRGLGETVASLRTLFSDWDPIEKITFSCFGAKPVETYLTTKKIKSVVLFGIETHICVLQTAIDLKAAGYNVVVVEDCVSSRRESDKVTALKRLQTEGILLTSYESILFELCQTAEHPEFKTISKLVK